MPNRFCTPAPVSLLPVRWGSPRGLHGVFAAVSLAGALLVTGCGAGRQLPAVSATSNALLHGKVHGG